MQGANSLTKQKTKSNVLVTDGIGTDIIKGSAFAVGAMAVGILGVWAISCMVSGIIEAGGPMNMFASWLGAVSGM